MKPPAVSHSENSVFADSRLWQERLKKGLYWAERVYVMSAIPSVKKPPAESKVKPPLAEPFIAEARHRFRRRAVRCHPQGAGGGAESLKKSPDAGQSRQVAMWEEAVSLTDPDAPEARAPRRGRCGQSRRQGPRRCLRLALRFRAGKPFSIAALRSFALVRRLAG